MKPWIKVVGLVVVVGLVALGGAGLWVKGKIDPGGPPGDSVVFVVASGTSTSAIADQLAADGVITDASVFRWYLRLTGRGPFLAGTYELVENSSMGDVAAALASGPALPDAVNLTIPEGLVVEEVVERVGEASQISAERFAELVASGEFRSQFSPEGEASLEGLLFPDTYRLEEGDDEAVLLNRMIGLFDNVATELGLADAESRAGVTPYEAVIVASLIEAEARVDEDRGKIARVIYNRLEQGIPLGIDATFYFALGPERKGTSLRQSDLQIDSPYNTRQNQGLVPTPIAMPGRASLAAALDPEPGPWLYYVLQDQTTHAFSESYDEFLRNKSRAEDMGLIP